MEKRGEKPGMRERLAELLDVPADAAADVPRVVLTGFREVLVTGHRGVMEYTDERIRVRAGRKTVTVEGCGLTVRVMTRTGILLDGDVRTIHFED